MIEEGKARINASEGKISRKLETFYNPLMKYNRDLTVELLNVLPDTDMQIALPLAGSGVRGIRFLLELPESKIKKIYFNDLKSNFLVIMSENFELNNLDFTKSVVSIKDANQFMLESTGFDYIDIDPFGSPVPFLSSSISRLSRKGILAVTATDTAPLAGTYPKACKRRYSAKPLRTEFMHENALRILIRKVQNAGAEHDKALTPIYSYFKDHYYRVFFRCNKGKQHVDEVLENHKYLLYCQKCLNRAVSGYNKRECCGSMMEYAGPMWVGSLWDTEIAEKLKFDPFSSIISDESKIDVVGFYDMHYVCKKYNKITIKLDEIIQRIRDKGFKVSRTHFSGHSLRCNASISEIVAVLD